MTMKALGGAIITLGFALLGSSAGAADYEHMMAMYTNRIADMTAGPGGTAAIISPDGTRLLHLGGDKTCVLDLAETGTWERTYCAEQSVTERPNGPEDMFWSPDGKRLLMPNYADAFLAFRDTDIEVFDPDTFAITNLTDDGYDGGLLKSLNGIVNYDVAPRWVDDDTIAFLRYVIPDEGMAARSGPFLMSIDTAGGAPQQFTKPLVQGKGMVYTLAAAPGGTRFAYIVVAPEGEKGAGLYVVDLTDGAPHLIATEAQYGRGTTGLAFSADGEFLAVLGPGDKSLDARVVDLSSGTILPVADVENVTGVAWSPTGHALAYIVWNGHDADSPGGLFLSPMPGGPGKLLAAGSLMTPACCGRQVFPWASNNMILLGRVEDMQTVLQVQLGL